MQELISYLLIEDLLQHIMELFNLLQSLFMLLDIAQRLVLGIIGLQFCLFQKLWVKVKKVERIILTHVEQKEMLLITIELVKFLIKSLKSY